MGGEPWARGHFVTNPLWFVALWTLQTANTTEGISSNARVGYRFCQGQFCRLQFCLFPRQRDPGEGREDGGISNGQADGRTDSQREEGRTQVRLYLLYKLGYAGLGRIGKAKMGVPVTSANSQWIVLGSCREAVDRRKWDSRVGWEVSFWAGGGHWAKPSLRHRGKVSPSV